MANNDSDLAKLTGRAQLPAELHDAPGLVKLEWVLGLADPAAFVGELTAPELYYWIHDIGKGDAYPLLELADREQKRALVDIDAWTRHELVIPRWLEWLDLSLAASEDTALDFVAAQDDETLSWLFSGDVMVHPSDHDLDFVPDDRAAFHTPDFMYLVTVPRDHPLEERIPQLLRLMWSSDEDRARALFQQAQFDLQSNITEDMERFRNARIQDFGFEPYTDALAVWTTVPAKALREAARKGELKEIDGLPPTPAAPPSRDLALSGVSAPELLHAALNGLDEATRFQVGERLAHLVNKVFVAETGDLSRVEDLPLIGAHAAATANLGLEYLADDDLGNATRLLAVTTPETLFKVGHTLVAELGRPARDAARRAGAPLGLALFGTPVDEVLHGAGLARPLYFEGLDKAELMGYRPFRTLADLARAELHIEDALALVGFFETRLGFRPGAMSELGLSAAEQRRVRFATLFRTAIVHMLLNDSVTFEPLATDDLRTFARIAFVKRGAAIGLADLLTSRLAALKTAGVEDSVRRFVERTMDELVDAIGGVGPDDLDPRFTGDLFLTRRH